MCGIAGLIEQNKTAVNVLQLKQMTDPVAHRGPNGDGFYTYENMGFGHRRLSIIDLSSAGDQPMKLDDDYVITYNGEIYNYIEVREELKRLGHCFISQSDTEVILVAYKQWGTLCTNKFNGMWAFAIHDIKKQVVFCSRDRFGIKPFYYTIIDSKFVFGSEIKQFSSFQTKKVVNKNILMDYLVFNLIDHTDETFFEGVKKLPGSHNLIYDLKTNKFNIYKYYTISIKPEISKLSEHDSVDLFQTEITRSVLWRLRSDVKVGTCLSGGLDSSYIASLASSNYNNNLEKFTAITAQSLYKDEDETEFAEQVVNCCNLGWLKTRPTITDFVYSLDTVIYNQEEPFISMSVYMQHFVMKKAHEGGIVVLLDGQGADELLLGYSRYMAAYFKSLPVSNLLTNILKSKDHFGVSAFELFKYYAYFSSYSVRNKRNMWRFNKIKSKYINYVDNNRIKAIANAYNNIDELQNLEIFSTQLPSLLRFEDKNSMASSIESRLPFLDWTFVETALSMNNKFKIKDGWSKYILRRSMHGRLPDDITWRKKKIGFSAPTSIWLTGVNGVQEILRKSEILREIFNNGIPHYDDPAILWRLINIARWEELYDVKID